MTAQKNKKCASGSVVEHLLAKERVAGSIPVSRLDENENKISGLDIFFCYKRGCL